MLSRRVPWPSWGLAEREGGGKVALKVINLSEAKTSAKVELEKMKTLLTKHADRLYDGSKGSQHVQRIIAICESCPLGDRMRDLEASNAKHQTLAGTERGGLELEGGWISNARATEVSIVVSELCANGDLNFWMSQVLANGSVRVRFFEHLVTGLAHMMRNGCSLPPCSHIAAPVGAARTSRAFLPRRIAGHRDLKPENVFIDGYGRLVVGDLGRVKFEDEYMKTYRERMLKQGVDVDQKDAAARLYHSEEVTNTDLGSVGQKTYMSSAMTNISRHYNPQQEDVYCCGTLLARMCCANLIHEVNETDDQNKLRIARRIEANANLPNAQALSRAYVCLVEKKPDIYLLEDIVKGKAEIAAGQSWDQVKENARERWDAAHQMYNPNGLDFDAIWDSLEWLRTERPATDAELKAAMTPLDDGPAFEFD